MKHRELAKREEAAHARSAGMRTVWMTYRQRLERPSPHGQFLGLAGAAENARPYYVSATWTELLA